jgi:hypothetical protein
MNKFKAQEGHCVISQLNSVFVGKLALLISAGFYIIIWFVRLLALRPLLAYCATLG